MIVTTLRRIRFVAALFASVSLASSAFAATYTWTNGAGSGLWAVPGNWSPPAPATGPTIADDLTLAANLSGMAGNSFLSLLTSSDANTVIRQVNAMTFSGGDAKYIWTVPPTTTGTALTGNRFFEPAGGITLAAGSGPVFIGNANEVARRPTVLRLQASQAFVNNSANDLTFGTPINTPFNATTGVGGNGTVTGAAINGIGGSAPQPLSVLTMSASAAGSIVNNGTMSNGTGGLQLVVNSTGTGRVILNGTSTFNSGNLGTNTGVIVNQGTLQIGTGGETGLLQSTNGGTSGIEVNSGGTLAVNRSATTTMNWDATSFPIAGTGALLVQGGMTLVFTKPQAFTGSTTVSSGTLTLGQDPNGGGTGIVTNGSLGGPIAVASGSVLSVNSPNSVTITNAVSGGGTFLKAGSGTVTIDGAFTIADIEVVDGQVTVGASGSLSPLSIIEVAAGRSFDLSAKSSAGVLGVVGGGTVGLPSTSLTAVALGPVGTLSFTGTGTLDITGATSSTLEFDLGSSSDTVALVSGTLAIGNGLINFDDFEFTAGSGFGAGLYTLFNAGTISGSLGSSLTGQIAGLDATLLLSGNSMQLSVVPEPSSLALATLGLAGAAWAGRRKLLGRRG
jgi:fibronectin-binding autotransporter adhesin